MVQCMLGCPPEYSTERALDCYVETVRDLIYIAKIKHYKLAKGRQQGAA